MVVGVVVVDVDDEVAARIEVVTVVVVEAGCWHCCSIRGHGNNNNYNDNNNNNNNADTYMICYLFIYQ